MRRHGQTRLKQSLTQPDQGSTTIDRPHVEQTVVFLGKVFLPQMHGQPTFLTKKIIIVNLQLAPLADAIHLKTGDEVVLYLSAYPLSPVPAQLRYMAHEAVQRPDGNFAYRVRATLSNKTLHRVGLKGTAKLHGDWVPLAFWVMRRPWATLRAYVGW